VTKTHGNKTHGNQGMAGVPKMEKQPVCCSLSIAKTCLCALGALLKLVFANTRQCA